MRWIKGLFQTALAIAAILLTVGANTAISNGKSWIDLVGDSDAFGFLASPQVRVYIAAVVFFALGFTAKGWVANWSGKQRPKVDGLSPYDLYSRMDALVYRIQQFFQSAPWGRGENRVQLATDCYSFNTTMWKAGYPVPDVTALDDNSKLAVLGFYYAQVGPYIRDGHTAEAKQIAAELSRPEAVAAATPKDAGH